MATISATAASAACDAITALINAGTPPGNVVFRTSGDAEVATLSFSTTAFGAASSGVATANAITSDTDATGGVVTKATLQNAAGTVIITATVDVADAEINLSNTTIGAGDTVSLTSLTVTMPTS